MGVAMLLARIYLENLNQAEEASRVVQLSQSVEGAKMVARYHVLQHVYIICTIMVGSSRR